MLLAAALGVLAANAQDEHTGVYDGEPQLPLLTPENKAKAIRAMKRVEKRSKKFNIRLNRGKMEKLKGERLFVVLREYDRFVSILEELPENFVKECGIDTVWFSDEIVDASGQLAGGFASGEGINLSVGSDKGTIYHEMFHKFERCLSESDMREWDDINPKDFIYTGSAWDAFAGNDRQSKKDAARHQRRIAMGKEKSAREKLEESRSKRDNRKIAENNANPEIQAAFINSYAQTTPKEDRAEVFRCMMVEGPAFLNRVRRSDYMRKKMEFMIRLTGKDRYLGRNFWDYRVETERMNDPEYVDSHMEISANGWRRAEPEKYGFDSARLGKIGTLIQRRKMGTTAVVIVVGGEVIYEYGDISETSDTSPAMAHSLLSLLYGVYVRRGMISLTETLREIGIDDIGGLLPREREATVKDLLTSRSGCYLPAANDNPKDERPQRGSVLPGSEFSYNNWGFNVAATIFEKKTGLSVARAFEEEIARPLGFEDWNFTLHRNVGNSLASQHLAHSFGLSARDMARIGEAMLRKGSWHGLQMLPREWIAESTSLVSKFPTGGGFGYAWWIENESQDPNIFRGAFSARGHGGQRLTILPALDMVVAHKSATGKNATKSADYKLLLTLISKSKRK